MSGVENCRNYFMTLSNKELYDMSFYFQDKVDSYNLIMDIIDGVIESRQKNFKNR